jgi:hypothetical protein
MIDTIPLNVCRAGSTACPGRNPCAVLCRYAPPRAHTNAPQNSDLLWGTLRALTRPGRAPDGVDRVAGRQLVRRVRDLEGEVDEERPRQRVRAHDLDGLAAWAAGGSAIKC